MDRPELIYDDETGPSRDEELFAVGRYTLDQMREEGVRDALYDGAPGGETDWERAKRIMASTRLEHVYFREPTEYEDESKGAVPCEEGDEGAWVCTRLVLEPRISVYASDPEDWSLGVWYADGGHFTEEEMRAEVEAEMRSAHGDDPGRWDDAAREDFATLERKAVLTHGWQQRGFIRDGEIRPLSASAWEEVMTALDGGEEGDALQVRECAPDAEHAIPYTRIDLVDEHADASREKEEGR